MSSVSLPEWISKSYSAIQTGLPSELNDKQRHETINLFAHIYNTYTSQNTTVTNAVSADFKGLISTNNSTLNTVILPIATSGSESSQIPPSGTEFPTWISSQLEDIQIHLREYFKLTDETKINKVISLISELYTNLDEAFPWKKTSRANISKKQTYSVSFHLKQKKGDLRNPTRQICSEIGRLLNWEFNFITLNKNVTCEPHRDTQNTTPSIIFSMGNYTGCDLIVEDETKDYLAKPIIFHGGKQLHWNTPLISGNKYSCVLYSLPDLTPEQMAEYRSNKGHFYSQKNKYSSSRTSFDSFGSSATDSPSSSTTPSIVASFNESSNSTGPTVLVNSTSTDFKIELPPQLASYPMWFQENYVGSAQFLYSKFNLSNSEINTTLRLFGAIYYFLEHKFPWKTTYRTNASDTPIFSVSWPNIDKQYDPKNPLRILVSKLAAILQFSFNFITANKDVVTKQHTSSFNKSNTLIFSLGSYSGADFVVNGSTHNTVMRPLEFDARKELHWNTPLTSDTTSDHKFSILLYNIDMNNSYKSKKPYSSRKNYKNNKFYNKS